MPSLWIIYLQMICEVCYSWVLIHTRLLSAYYTPDLLPLSVTTDEDDHHWSVLTVREIVDTASKDMTIPAKVRKAKKSAIIEYIEGEGNIIVQYTLTRRADERKEDLHNKEVRKRKRKEEVLQQRKAIKLQAEADEDRDDARDLSKYLELPSDEVVLQCYQDFYDATSNAPFVQAICGVCARNVFVKECPVQAVKLSDLPGSQRLVPHHPHPQHDLYDGKLLQPEGVSVNDFNETMVNICWDCSKDLRRKSDKPPRLSLANNLWVGKIPWQLLTMTQPEQMLITPVFTRIYVYRLHTKNATYQPDPSLLQSALRGTVSTYPLDINAASSMVQGDFLPRCPKELPSVIAITFIGRGKIPLNQLVKMFRVRRQIVLDALLWLKEHNPKYYEHISIAFDVAMELPEDGIPVELLRVICQDKDVGVLDEQNDTYVPHRQDDEVDG